MSSFIFGPDPPPKKAETTPQTQHKRKIRKHVIYPHLGVAEVFVRALEIPRGNPWGNFMYDVTQKTILEVVGIVWDKDRNSAPQGSIGFDVMYCNSAGGSGSFPLSRNIDLSGHTSYETPYSFYVPIHEKYTMLEGTASTFSAVGFYVSVKSVGVGIPSQEFEIIYDVYEGD